MTALANVAMTKIARRQPILLYPRYPDNSLLKCQIDFELWVWKKKPFENLLGVREGYAKERAQDAL